MAEFQLLGQTAAEMGLLGQDTIAFVRDKQKNARCIC